MTKAEEREELAATAEPAMSERERDAAELCDDRAAFWRQEAHKAANDEQRAKAVGMWTGFQCAAEIIRGTYPQPSKEGTP